MRKDDPDIDTKMIASEMITAIIASCAQAESESISKNMRWSMKKRMENLTKLNENGFLHPDAYISRSNRLAEQLRAAKQKKEKLLGQEDDDLIVKTR